MSFRLIALYRRGAYKQLLDEVFVISGIIKVEVSVISGIIKAEVSVISRSRRPWAQKYL